MDADTVSVHTEEEQEDMDGDILDDEEESEDGDDL